MTELLVMALEVARLLLADDFDGAERKAKALAQSIALKRAARAAAKAGG